MQRTVSPVVVMSMAPSQRFATLEQDSVIADPMCRDTGVMNVSLKHLAYNQPRGVFPATAILLGLNHLTVKRMDSVGASLVLQGRNVTVVPGAISTSKKEAAQLVTVPTWVITVTQKLVNAFALQTPLEKNVLNVHQIRGATVFSLVVRLVIAAWWAPWISSAM